LKQSEEGTTIYNYQPFNNQGMFITNAKVFTTRDQNDLETLERFAQNLFDQYNALRKTTIPLEPADFFEERKTYSCYKVPEGMTLQFLLDNGAEYVALESDDSIERPGKQLVIHKYQFKPEEIAQNSDQLARYVIEKKEIEGDLKEVKSAYKARLDEKDAQIGKYSHYVAQGFDMRDVECRVLVNYKEKQKQYISISSNEIIRTEELNSDDYQYFISFPELGTAQA
jgi:hypothetical protein